MLSWLKGYFAKNNPARNFFLTFLILCCCYRGYFFYLLEHNPQSFVKINDSETAVGLGFLEDIVIGMGLAFVIILIQFLLRRYSPSKTRLFIRTLACALLVFFAIDFMAYTKVFFLMHTAFTMPLLRVALHQGSLSQSFSNYATYLNWLGLIAPLILFISLEIFKPNKLIFYTNRTLVICIALLGAEVAYYHTDDDSDRNFFVEVLHNPVVFLANSFKTDCYYATQYDQPNSDQMASLAFVDPEFINKNLMTAKPQVPLKKDWNVIIYVMESVSSAYVLKSPSFTDKDTPMPFLKKLSQEGLWLTNNYAAGNTTTLAEFGLLTGLYPSPAPDNFEMQKSIFIPSILDWLGKKKYHSLFVMASNSHSYFGRNLLESFGFEKIYDYFDIDAVSQRRVATAGEWDAPLNEPRALDFFINKLQSMGSPFLAIYWSNANHGPYKDSPYFNMQCTLYDESCVYTKNLHIVDQGLERLFSYLKSANLLENTIVIVVGDHGEGFGKNYLDRYHGQYLFQDQITAPLLFWQPALFKPRVTHELTSNLDLVPTLLTAMGISYNPALLQGETIGDEPTQRKYVFVYGIEDELTAIDRDNHKILISFQDGVCASFDLKLDPSELNPRNCRHDMREKILIKFRNFQHIVLENYNHNRLRGLG